MDIIDCNVGELGCEHCGHRMPVFVLGQHLLEMENRGRLVHGVASCSLCKRKWDVLVARTRRTAEIQLAITGEVHR